MALIPNLSGRIGAQLSDARNAAGNQFLLSYRRICGLISGFKTTFFIFCFLVLAVSSSFPLTCEASGIVVSNVEVQGLYSIGKEEFLYLLGIRPGRSIDEETVRSGIKTAFLKGIFEDISLETVDGDESRVIVHVRERDFIKKIEIDGHPPISAKKIREMFLIKQENYLACDTIEKAISDLKPKLAFLGFPRSTVGAEIERLKEPFRINIRLFIEAGEPEIVKQIRIMGTDEDVMKVMKLSEGDIYDQNVLKKDLGRIRTYLKKQGYFKPLVERYTYSEGALAISVDPGKKLHVSFEGNDDISDKTLMKEIPFFAVEDFNDGIIQEAVQKLTSLYYSKGYPFVQITPDTKIQDDFIHINFIILEGAEVKVGTISFDGNSIPADRLKDIMSLKEGKKYNPDLIDANRELISNFYTALGYLSAIVEDFETVYEEKAQLMNINITVREWLKTEIEKITVSGATAMAESEIRNAIKIKGGDPYNEVDISDARYRIIELYSNRGYPEVRIEVQRKFEGLGASLSFKIEEGDKKYFGRTIVTGNTRTKYKVIDRELSKKEGLPYNYSLLAQERQKLYKLGLFSDIEFKPLDDFDDRRDVLVNLREGDAGTVEFGFGYTDYERLRGFVDVSYRNLWGLNRQASLRLELSTIERRYIFQYREPWFMDRPIPFRFYLLGEDKKEVDIDTRDVRYRLERHAATAGFEKKLTKTIKADLYYEFSVVRTYDVEPDVILSKEDTGTLIISGIRFGLIHDTRDNPFYPGKGILSGVSTKFTTPLLFSETDFVKVMFHFNTYHTLTRGIVFAASFRGGIAEGYRDTAELPIVERFFLGGRLSVRGYEQDTLGPKGTDGNPTGGNAFLMESLEIRASITRSIGVVVFLDGGNVWQRMSDIDVSEFKFTTGLGLRYNTPVGPVRVDYGHKLDREKGESAGEVHFSIGHAF